MIQPDVLKVKAISNAAIDNLENVIVALFA
jgi:hypothetical protein